MTQPTPNNPPPAKNRRPLFAVVILLLILLAAFLLWRSPLFSGVSPAGDRAATASPAALPPSLTIFYTCDTSGHMEPCRCSSGQAGGIGRRLGWLDQQQSETDAWLLVDAGDVAGGGEDWQWFELKAILKGYAQAGYHAVNIGHRELALGPDRLRELRSHAVPIVSSNVHGPDGQLIFPPYRIVDLPGGARAGVIGITGVDDGSDPPEPLDLPPGISVSSPAEALDRWLPELREHSEMIVLLAFANEKTIQSLAERYDDIDVIVGGDTFFPTGEPLRFNSAHVVLITDQGKGIGRLQLTRSPETDADTGDWSAANKIVVLTEDLPADANFDRVYEDYKRQLAAQNFRPTAETPDTSLPARYVGAESCRECHPVAHDLWNDSGHHHAFASLEQQNNHFNPRCLACHTVGYAVAGGYVSPDLTPTLKNVQCESCHGPGGDHVRAQRDTTLTDTLSQLRSIDCRTCHDEQNSPGFDRESFWAKIRH
jgi:2',3'-cyclic-nucleotide 2'-phosphodiesterase (5'-nucleotidase family)